MPTEKTNKKTAEEGKNIKNKKAKTAAKKPSAKKASTKTIEMPDVNSDVDQE